MGWWWGYRKLDEHLNSIFSKCLTLAILIKCILHMFWDLEMGFQKRVPWPQKKPSRIQNQIRSTPIPL